MFGFLFNSNSRFIVITDNDVFIGKSEEDVNKKAGGLIERVEYKRVGNDYVSILSNEALHFVIDKMRLANIPWSKLSKKDNSFKMYFFILILLQVIILVKG